MSHYLDRFYKSFQTNTNPYVSDQHIKKVRNLIEVMQDNKLENRDLIYSLFCYYSLGHKYPMPALKTMHYLSTNYKQRFNQDHPIFYLHSLESLIGFDCD